MNKMLLLLMLLLPFDAVAGQVGEKDLAMILPALHQLRLPAQAPWLEDAWWERLREAYRDSPVGEALEVESPRQDWRLVAVRIAPCQPLLPYLTAQNDDLCTAEVRLVWQPFVASWENGLAQADDRAIHALYHVDEDLLLEPQAAARHRELMRRAATLGPEESSAFAALQQQLVKALLGEVRALRSRPGDEPYQGLGARPEFADAQEAAGFMRRLEAFLARHARPTRLKELTSFSLPVGRQPPKLDLWVFLAFDPARGGLDLQPKSIVLNSKKTGRRLLDLGPSLTVTMSRDDDQVYDALASLDPSAGAEVQDALILKFQERRGKRAMIADPGATHIAHTSCASCHKLNRLAFDFHNLSHLQTRPMTISPRVQQDVARELRWLERL